MRKDAFACLRLVVFSLVALVLLTLAARAADPVEGQVNERIPGCTSTDGEVKIINRLTEIHLRVSMVAEFANTQSAGGPEHCGGGCGATGCNCTAQGTVEAQPGTVKWVACSFPACAGCSNCDNDFGDCPFDPEAFCSDVDEASIELRVIGYSVDGSTFYSLSASDQHELVETEVLTPCS